jgi:polyphenol oxidase
LSGDNVLNAPLGGSIENVQHDAIHHWTGDPSQSLAQDMGTFSTAARDPVFYAHHTNLDRLWTVWETLPGGDRRAPADADFLDAEFEFFDENANLVKVKARDALDSKKLGIGYESRSISDQLWIEFEPNSTSVNGSAVEYARQRYGATEITEARANVSGNIDVGDKLIALVKRQPDMGAGLSNRSEALIVQGIGAARERFVQMLVFVNLPDAGRSSASPVSSAEYIGAFNIVPTAASSNKSIFVNAKFQLADAVQRLGLSRDDEIVVTLLIHPPDSGVTIKGMKIVYE